MPAARTQFSVLRPLCSTSRHLASSIGLALNLLFGPLVLGILFIATANFLSAKVEDSGQSAVLSPSSDAYRFVEIPVCKTSIYIGSVTMTMGRFERKGDSYQAGYDATVFPFFFYREKGTISIVVGDENLIRLAKGESISIKGTARTISGELRRIEGFATPSDARSGKIKIKVFVSRSIKLSFNCTYRFSDFASTTTSPSSR